VKSVAKITVHIPAGLPGATPGTGSAEAFLGEDLRWYSANRLLQSVLRTEQTPYSPADGEPGRKMLAEAVESLGRRRFTVQAEWLSDQPIRPGDVAFIKGILHKPGVKNGQLAIPVKKIRGRVFCAYDGTINLAASDKAHVAVHEMGHHIEFQVPGVKQAALASPDLARLVDAWLLLPEHVRRAILTLADGCR
jgi:hypothetical protein